MCVVTKDGFTLLMKAVLGNRPETIRALVSLPECPKDFRQMKVSFMYNLISVQRYQMF